MIHYKCAAFVLSSTGLYIDFLCILLCGTPILGDFENSFGNTSVVYRDICVQD